MKPTRWVFLGLSITSSWGNGHATTYRGLLRELRRRGHEILFLERDVPWYAENRDTPQPPYCQVELYSSLSDLKDRFANKIESAERVIIGSYVPEGVLVAEWVLSLTQGTVGFYDIDTPVTLAKLSRGDFEYLTPELISRYDVYLSFTGGPLLKQLELQYGSPLARPLYCSVDPESYFPESTNKKSKWNLGYLGTYSPDRQPTLEHFLLDPARSWHSGRFVVAGPQFPDSIQWPSNVHRIEHLSPAEHRAFYNNLDFTLNVTREDMIRAGYSPSVRLFEAAACGVPIISDSWPGLDHFFDIGREILVAHSSDEVMTYLRELPEELAHQIGDNARKKVLRQHTAAHRAQELEQLMQESEVRKKGVLWRKTS